MKYLEMFGNPWKSLILQGNPKNLEIHENPRHPRKPLEFQEDPANAKEVNEILGKPGMSMKIKEIPGIPGKYWTKQG